MSQLSRSLTIVILTLAGCSPELGVGAPSPSSDAGTDTGHQTDGASFRLPRDRAPSCESRMAAIVLDEPSPRHERFFERRPEIVVHSRITPMLHLLWPDRTRSARALEVRGELERSSRPRAALREFMDSNEGDRTFVREVILSDGFLFAEAPSFARALSAQVRFDDLFEEEAVFRYRDGETLELTRNERGDYLTPQGARASLRLGDRVGLDVGALAPNHAISLEVVRQQTGAVRTVPISLNETSAGFELFYPDGSIRPALVQVREAQTDVVCVGGDLATLSASLRHAASFWSRHRATRRAARAMVRQRIRFDEPVNEPEGIQEDGRLRLAWRRAYLRGYSEFIYRDISYPVFDAEGGPRPPQVCIDFVFDTYNRAAGSWFRARGSEPGRTLGAFDLARISELPQRSIAQLVRYGRESASVFSTYDVPRPERVSLSEGRGYARAIARWSSEIREGDTLIIYGLRERDMNYHHHAVLVIRTDPVSGVPMTVADNQSRPRFRTIAGAMRAAPLRSISHRLRPDFGALAELGSTESALAGPEADREEE